MSTKLTKKIAQGLMQPSNKDQEAARKWIGKQIAKRVGEANWVEAYHKKMHDAWLNSPLPRGPYGVPSIIGGKYLDVCVGPGLDDITLHSAEEASNYISKCDDGLFRVSHN